MSNQGHNGSAEAPDKNRRTILQGLAIGGFGSATAGIAALADDASAASCRIPDGSESADEESYERKESNADYYEFQNSTYRYDRLTDLQSSLIYKGATYSDYQNQWYHSFRTGGYSKTMRKESSESKSSYEFNDTHDYVKTTIDNENTRTAALYTTNNPREVGMVPAPSPDGDPDYGDAAYTLMLAVLGAKPYVGVAITAAQILSALTYTDKSGSGSQVEYSWDYDNDNMACEAAHFINFDMKSAEGEETASVSVEHEVTYNAYGGVRATESMTVDAVPDNVQSISSGGISLSRSGSDKQFKIDTGDRKSPDPSDPGYPDWLVQNGLAEKVANEDIERKEVKEIAKGGPVYHATNPVVSSDSSSTGFEL